MANKKGISRRAKKITKNNQTLNLFDYLNRIITTQIHLTNIDFNLESFINFAIVQLKGLTKADGIAVELVQDGNKTIYQYVCGTMKKAQDLQCNLNDSLSVLSINTHQIIRCDNSKQDERLNKQTLALIGSPLSLITAPLFHEGNVTGTICMTAKKGNYFDDMSIQFLRIMSGLIGYAISQKYYQSKNEQLQRLQFTAMENLKKAEKKLEQSIHHDYLTGLPNRNLFNMQLNLALKKAKRKKQLMAIMHLNIDFFKKVNETAGPSYGDKVLVAFALRLKQCLRDSDLIARLGGDEFIIMVDDIKEPQDAIVIVDKLLQTVRQPFNFNKKLFNLTTSVGIAFLNDPNITSDNFIKQADQALYIAKNSGRNNFYIFNSELQHEAI